METSADEFLGSGALRARGVQPDDLPELVRRYEEGCSLARLSVEFGVAAGTVGSALRKAGVTIRRPNGGAGST